MSSDRPLQMRGGSSLRGRGVVSRARLIPPHCAASGFAVAAHGNLQSAAGPVLSGQHGTVTAVDLAGGDPVLAGQGLDQGPFHDVLQLAEPVPVECQPVVLRDAPELGLELTGPNQCDRADYRRRASLLSVAIQSEVLKAKVLSGCKSDMSHMFSFSEVGTFSLAPGSCDRCCALRRAGCD
jgi:hypothetical protein